MLTPGKVFRLVFVATLAVGLGLLVWGIINGLATVLTYVGAALFLALGLDPLIAWLEKKRFPRWAAILTVLVGVISVFSLVVANIIPILIVQFTELVQSISVSIAAAQTTTSTPIGALIEVLDERIQLSEYVDVDAALTGLSQWLQDPGNIANIGTGVLQVGAGIITGIFAALIILILTIYFTASLKRIKATMYRFVPASKRDRFIDLSEQITSSVGRFVVGQFTQALINGILSLIFLSIIQAPYPLLLASIAFLFGLIPLVGTLTASIIITLSCLIESPTTAIIAGIYYLIYMQLEAYVLSPRIMGTAVKVPGSVVVIAALAGGTLLGLLGALIAIPTAAAIIILLNQVFFPKVDEL
jgi:predicted PurR-regulated permease PerM